jgi:hypothetical protein
LPLRELVSVFEYVTGANLNIKWGARQYRYREVMQTWSNYQKLPGWEAKVSLRKGIASLI